jgi:hypothetical protein
MPDGPVALEWLLPSGVILTSVLFRPTQCGPDDPLDKARPAVCRVWIPYAARAWRRVTEEGWRRIEDLPREWQLRPAQGGPLLPKGDYIKAPEEGYADD